MGKLELGAWEGNWRLLRDSRKIFGLADRRWEFLELLGLQVVLRRLALEDLELWRGK